VTRQIRIPFQAHPLLVLNGHAGSADQYPQLGMERIQQDVPFGPSHQLKQKSMELVSLD
jgi:hypothetical protein